jgi:signal transduction histidine kinase
LLQLRLDHLVSTVRNSSSTAEKVELPPLLRETVQLFLKGLAPEDRPIQIETACDANVKAVRIDPGRLMQALLNLLNNAQQALSRLDRDGRIVVRLGTEEKHGQRWVVVDVVDDGPGVPEAFIDRIFEPFFTTRDGGTGYGLYLAAELIKEQSGQLTVVNNPEGGAMFRIWLPETDSVPRTDTDVCGQA